MSWMVDKSTFGSNLGRPSQWPQVAKGAATTSPPQKLEVTVPPVSTSSQASMEEAEGSLEDIPANISLIATIHSSRSVSPLLDPSELQANANRAIDNMLHLKRSLDIRRQRATGELGAMLHQNKSQGATLITAAKAICSEAVMEAKTNDRTAIMEAKKAKHHLIQAAKVTFSKAISDAKAQTTSQAAVFQEEHYNYQWSLEERALGEESRSHHDVLSPLQVTLHHSSHSIRGVLAVSYHLLLGQTPPSPSLIQPPRTPPVEEQTSSAAPPMPMPKQSLETEKAPSFTRANGDMPLGRATPVAALGGPPLPKK